MTNKLLTRRTFSSLLAIAWACSSMAIYGTAFAQQSEATQSPAAATPVVSYLALPSTALPGSDMVVNWSGPAREGDQIYVVKAGEDTPLHKVSAGPKDFKPAIIKAPHQGGDYQLKLISNNTQLATANFSVVSAKARLRVLTPIVLRGELVEVEWNGPRKDGDQLKILPIGMKNMISKSPASGTVKSVLSLPAPKKAGDYQVQLENRQGEVLVKQHFKVR